MIPPLPGMGYRKRSGNMIAPPPVRRGSVPILPVFNCARYIDRPAHFWAGRFVCLGVRNP